MSRILAYTTTRANTLQRRELLTRTIREGREKAGQDFSWHIFNYSQDDDTRTLLTQLSSEMKLSIIDGVNEGQHIAFNTALDMAHQGGFDYLLRIDDDIEFMSHRWLAKMVEAATTLGPQFIISPTIKGLNHPPSMSQPVTIEGVECRFLDEAIGGACRLHSTISLIGGDYVSDVRLPMGAGDATGIMEWAKQQTTQGNQTWAVWLEHVRVRHSTTVQVTDDPTYHSLHALYQTIPYIPSWTPNG